MPLALWAVVIVVVLVMWGLLWQEVASVRREQRETNRYLEAMGKAAGWWPPRKP